MYLCWGWRCWTEHCRAWEALLPGCPEKGSGVLTAFGAPALAPCCLGERFLCDLSKTLSCAAEGGRETLSGVFSQGSGKYHRGYSSECAGGLVLERWAGVINLVLLSLWDVPLHSQTSLVELWVCASEKWRSRTQHLHVDGSNSAWMPYSSPFCGDKIIFEESRWKTLQLLTHSVFI